MADSETTPGFRAVLFDLDGTLLDTLEDLACAMNGALKHLGCPVHDSQAYRYFIGDGLRVLATRALPADRADDATVRACIEAMRREYRERWDRTTRPYDGVPELLDSIASRGLRLAVLSNKPDEFTRLCVERFFDRRMFDAVRGVCEEVPPKPDPAGAIGIAAAMGIPPAAFICVGDTATDMRTAVAAGMVPIGVLWGFRAADELTENGARALIAHPPELLPLL